MKRRNGREASGRWMARVSVGLKPEVLDPQGKTVMKALSSLGFRSVDDVRVGKHFWITLKGKLSREAAEKSVKRMTETLLVNPVIEHCTFVLGRAGNRAR